MAKRLTARQKQELQVYNEPENRFIEVANKLGMTCEWELQNLKDIIDCADTKEKDRIDALKHFDYLRETSKTAAVPDVSAVSKKEDDDKQAQIVHQMNIQTAIMAGAEATAAKQFATSVPMPIEHAVPKDVEVEFERQQQYFGSQ